MTGVWRWARDLAVGPAAADAPPLPSPWRYRRLWAPELAVVLLVAVVGTALFTWTTLDIDWMRPFYVPGATEAWPHQHDWPWTWLYRFSAVPIIGLAVGAFVVLVGGYRRTAWQRWRLPCVFILLSIALGPGLVVNLVLKEQWGRPRPRDIGAFAGRYPFRPVLAMGVAGQGKSFPCGHCSVGFVFCVFYFLNRRRRLVRALGWLLAAGILGLAFGAGRVLAGGHFPSDVLWTAIVVFGVTGGLYYGVLNVPGREDRGWSAPASRTATRRALLRLAVLLVAIVIGALLATPVYQEVRLPKSPTGLAPPAAVRLRTDLGDLEIEYTAAVTLPVLEGTVTGFGWSGSRVRPTLRVEQGGQPTTPPDSPGRGSAPGDAPNPPGDPGPDTAPAASPNGAGTAPAPSPNGAGAAPAPFPNGAGAANRDPGPGDGIWEIALEPSGIFTERNLRLRLRLPLAAPPRVVVHIGTGNVYVTSPDPAAPPLVLEVNRGRVELPAAWRGHEAVQVAAPDVAWK